MLPVWLAPKHCPTQCWFIINSLRPSDAIWRHRSGSILAQVMACCLTAPSHYLKQCWLLINELVISQELLKIFIHDMSLKITHLRQQPNPIGTYEEKKIPCRMLFNGNYLKITRKSRYYACGKWQYPVLRIKKSYFRVKPCERNNKGNIWAPYKDNNKN